MKRIGFFLESLHSDQAMADLVSRLNQRDDVEIVVLVLEDRDPAGVWDLRGGVERPNVRPAMIVRRFLFRLVIQTEAWLRKCFSSDLRRSLGSAQVDGTAFRVWSQCRNVELVSGESVCDDSTALDLAVVGSGAPKLIHEALSHCTDGALRIRYGLGDHQGMHHLALAVLAQAPSTSYTIDLHTASSEYVQICRSGLVATRTSITRNRVDVAAIAYRQLEGLLFDYLRTGLLEQREGSQARGAPEPIAADNYFPESGTILRYTKGLVCQFVMTRLFPKRQTASREWHVGYLRGTKRLADLSEAAIIANPAGRYFADPFVIKHEDRVVCYVEDFSYEEGRGRISAIELADDGGYELLGPVVHEDFHMSFPFVFRFEGSLYMVPETQAVGQVRLYVCESFPMGWRFVGTCLDGLAAVDPIVFEHSGRWWLLCGLPVASGGPRDVALHIFYSSSPLSSSWESHALNPVLVDNANARNGGILFDKGRLPIRVRQSQGFDQYGSAFSLARISELSTTTYEEVEVDRITFEDEVEIHGAHHLSRTEGVMVTDFLMMSSTDSVSPAGRTAKV